MATFTVEYLFRLRDRFTGQAQKIASASQKARSNIHAMGTAFNKMEHGANRAGAALTRLATRMRAMRTVGRGIGTGGLMGLAGGGYSIMRGVSQMHDMQKAMNEVRANMQGVTPSQFNMLDKEVMSIANDTPFTYQETAKGLLELARMGMKANEAMEILRPSMMLAGAAGVDAGKTVDILTNVMSALNIPLKQTLNTSDMLTAAFTNSNQTILHLREALKFAQPTMIASGHTLQEVLSGFMLLAKRGLKGGIAGTTYARMMEAMDKTGKQQMSSWTKLGLARDEFFTPDGKNIPLVDIMQKLTDAKNRVGLKKFKEAAYSLFGARANRGVKLLIDNIDKLNEEYATLNKRQGATQRAMDEQMAGLPGAWARVKAAMSSALRSLDKNGMGKDLEGLANGARGLLENFQALSPETQQLIGRIALAFGAFSAIVIPLGILSMTLGALIGPILALGGGLRIMVGLLWNVAAGMTGAFMGPVLAATKMFGVIGGLAMAFRQLRAIAGKAIVFTILWEGSKLLMNWEKVKASFAEPLKVNVIWPEAPGWFKWIMEKWGGASEAQKKTGESSVGQSPLNLPDTIIRGLNKLRGVTSDVPKLSIDPNSAKMDLPSGGAAKPLEQAKAAVQRVQVQKFLPAQAPIMPQTKPLEQAIERLRNSLPAAKLPIDPASAKMALPNYGRPEALLNGLSKFEAGLASGASGKPPPVAAPSVPLPVQRVQVQNDVKITAPNSITLNLPNGGVAGTIQLGAERSRGATSTNSGTTETP